MLDENEHSRKEDGRSLHRLLHKTEQQDATVEVDSAAFFSELRKVLAEPFRSNLLRRPAARSKTPPAPRCPGEMGHTSPRNEGRSC